MSTEPVPSPVYVITDAPSVDDYDFTVTVGRGMHWRIVRIPAEGANDQCLLYESFGHIVRYVIY